MQPAVVPQSPAAASLGAFHRTNTAASATVSAPYHNAPQTAAASPNTVVESSPARSSALQSQILARIEEARTLLELMPLGAVIVVHYHACCRQPPPSPLYSCDRHGIAQHGAI